MSQTSTAKQNWVLITKWHSQGIIENQHDEASPTGLEKHIDKARLQGKKHQD
jgi:hypothetical protein